MIMKFSHDMLSTISNFDTPPYRIIVLWETQFWNSPHIIGRCIAWYPCVFHSSFWYRYFFCQAKKQTMKGCAPRLVRVCNRAILTKINARLTRKCYQSNSALLCVWDGGVQSPKKSIRIRFQANVDLSKLVRSLMKSSCQQRCELSFGNWLITKTLLLYVRSVCGDKSSHATFSMSVEQMIWNFLSCLLSD